MPRLLIVPIGLVLLFTSAAPAAPVPDGKLADGVYLLLEKGDGRKVTLTDGTKLILGARLSPSVGTAVKLQSWANDNTRFLIFKRGTTGQSFAASTTIGTYSVTANQTISFNDTPGAGTWKYWCGAENISGVPSASQASVTTVVT